jgi:hypothetical protein
MAGTAITSAARRAMNALMTFIPHLAIHQPFDAGDTDALLSRHGLERPDSRRVLLNLFTRELRSAPCELITMSS